VELSWLSARLTPLALCCVFTGARLFSYALDSSVTNPGVPILAGLLCVGGLITSRCRASSPDERSAWGADGLSAAALGLYLIALTRQLLSAPLRSLSASHPQVIEGALLDVSLEGLALWLLLASWWRSQPAPLRARGALPLLIGIFALPIEAWLRRWDEPLQRLGAALGAELASGLGALAERWGQAPLELKFWNPYTFYSSEFYLIINETCSGVNLLLSSALYALGFTWLTHGGPRLALKLALLSVPLSLASNACRIALIFCLGHYGSVELAMGPWHEGSAYLCQLPVIVLIAYLSPSSQGRSGPQRS